MRLPCFYLFHWSYLTYADLHIFQPIEETTTTFVSFWYILMPPSVCEWVVGWHFVNSATEKKSFWEVLNLSAFCVKWKCCPCHHSYAFSTHTAQEWLRHSCCICHRLLKRSQGRWRFAKTFSSAGGGVGVCVCVTSSAFWLHVKSFLRWNCMTWPCMPVSSSFHISNSMMCAWTVRPDISRIWPLWKRAAALSSSKCYIFFRWFSLV